MKKWKCKRGREKETIGVLNKLERACNVGIAGDYSYRFHQNHFAAPFKLNLPLTFYFYFFP